MSNIYYCTQEDNYCPKKENCKRYVELNDEKCHATLFKTACTEDNDYVLYMKHNEEIKEEGDNQ